MIPHWLPTREHCQSVFPCKLQATLPETKSTFLQLIQEDFAPLLLQCPVAGGIRLGVYLMTPWLDPPQPYDIWATVILGNGGPTKFRGNERGEGVQYRLSDDWVSQTPLPNLS